jgi:ferredoxin-type protein NapF
MDQGKKNLLDKDQVNFSTEGVLFSLHLLSISALPMLSNAFDPSRRNFLKGRVSARHASAQRPPWADRDSFLDLCTRCNHCIRVCEEKILVVGDGGYPEINFKSGACSFCGECARVCEPKALDDRIDPPWSITAEIDQSCLSERGITCRSCGDGCDYRAVRFQLQTGGRARLFLDQAACTGCGGCVAVCPVNAIRITAAEPRERQRA